MGELLQRQLVTVRVRIAMGTSFPIVGLRGVTSPTLRSTHQDPRLQRVTASYQ